jgi:2,4-dienoyl-CoA reductase-like NADH-dependent reductase (Old Yellow Enzyme family)
MGSAGSAAPLFTPFRLGDLTVANRFVMAPMTRERSPDGVPSTDVANYYRRRAAGGVGLLITEGTYIDHPTAVELPAAPRLFGAEALAAWRVVIDGVHAEGGAIAAQLWHAGSERDPARAPFPAAPRLSPSGISLGAETIGAAATAEQLAEVVAAYVRSALVARDLGFDAVEIHAAHGYLLDQFLWERTNRRSGGRGGDPRSRSVFPAEVVAAVRAAVGPGYPVLIRLSQWKLRNYDARSFADPDELAAVVKNLADAGVAAFHMSTHRHWEPAFDGTPLGLAGWVRKLTGLPTVAVGSVGLRSAYSVDAAGGRAARAGLEHVLRQFHDGEFDLIAVGRALLQDPQWVAKIRDGRPEQLLDFDPAALDTLR